MEKKRTYTQGRLGSRHLGVLIQALGSNLPDDVNRTVLSRDARLGSDDWTFDTDDQLLMVADEATTFAYSTYAYHPTKMGLRVGSA